MPYVLGEWEKPPLNEMMHYGVKGMKWGIRKIQDDSPTLPEKGLTDEQKKKLKTAAIVIVSAIAIAAAAYFARRYLLKYGSRTIKAGTDIQHMSKILNEDFSKPVYISYLKSDNKEYRNGYFKEIGAPFVKTLQTKKDVKIAGKRDVLKAFEEWSKTNTLTNSTGKQLNNFNNKGELKRAYRSFNYMMVSPDYRDQKLRDSFFIHLQDKGYSAIHDLHDQQKGSGITAPLIMFGQGSNIMTTKIKDIDASKLSESSKKAYDYWMALNKGV